MYTQEQKEMAKSAIAQVRNLIPTFVELGQGEKAAELAKRMDNLEKIFEL